MLNWFRKRAEPIETRASASGFTAEIMAARESYLAGRSGLGELTGTVQVCVSLWENTLTLADVKGTEFLRPSLLAMIGRSLALRGEALFLIDDDRLVPASDWELTTRNGQPVAYRLSISEAGGGRTQTALAGEVLHFRIGCDTVTPWIGQSPLRRASLTAQMLHALETALAEVYECAPLGSQIVPYPEGPATDLEKLGRSFRGQRGRILLRESVSVTAAGGPVPQTDWRPAGTSPDLSKSMTKESLEAARDSIFSVYGILPALFSPDTTGPLVREAQRHVVQYTVQPIADLIAEQCSDKLGAEVALDVLSRPQAYDSSGRARAMATAVEALARAKEAGIDDKAIADALSASLGP